MAVSSKDEKKNPLAERTSTAPSRFETALARSELSGYLRSTVKREHQAQINPTLYPQLLLEGKVANKHGGLLFVDVVPTPEYWRDSLPPLRTPITKAARVGIPVDIAPVIPVGVGLTIRVWSKERNDDNTGDVYTLMTCWWCVIDTYDLKKWYKTTELIQIGTNIRLGTVTVRFSDKHKTQLTVDSKLPTVARSLPDKCYGRRIIQPAYVSYVVDLKSAVDMFDMGEALYPNGKQFHRTHLPPYIDTVLGPVPIVVALAVFNRLPLKMNTIVIDSFVNNLIRMVCIERGISIPLYETLMGGRDFALSILCRLVRLLPSLVASATDIFGEAFTGGGVDEANMQGGSNDCEELARLCALMVRYINATSTHNKWTEKMREILENYCTVYAIMTSRTGNPEDSKDGTKHLHIVCLLAPKEYMIRLTDGSSERRMKAPKRPCPTMMMECLTDAASNPGIKLPRAGFGDSEWLILTPTLHRAMTMKAQVDYKYSGDIIALYIKETEFIPLTRRGGDGNSWRLGINLMDFISQRNPDRHLVVGVQPLTNEALLLVDDLARETMGLNFLRFDPLKATLDDKRVNEMADLSARTNKKLFFTKYSEAENNKVTLPERIRKEVQESLRRLERRPELKSEFQGLKAVVYQRPIYVLDNLNTVRAVGLIGGGEGAGPVDETKSEGPVDNAKKDTTPAAAAEAS